MHETATSSMALPDAQKRQLEAIKAEIAPVRDAGQLRKARRSLDALLSNIPQTDDYRVLRAAVRAQRADVDLDLGNPGGALEDAQAAVDDGWQRPAVFDVAGWAAYNLDRADSALAYFDRALSRAPDVVSSLMGRALALVDVADYERARSDLNHAINLDATDAELYALRGDVFVRLAQFDQAERDLRQARQLDDDPDYALQMARLMAVQGRAQQAIDAVGAAVDAEETALEALLLRSHLHVVGGRHQAGRDDAIRASNKYPDEAFAFVQLAHVQLASGKGQLALKAAQRAVDLDASLSDAYLVRGAARHDQGAADQAGQDLERARQAPAELPMFLLGSCYDVVESSGFETSMGDMLNQYSQAVNDSDGSAPKDTPQMPAGFDPMQLLGQVFDESGHMKGRFKPLLEMAMKNAPNILKNVPPGLLQNVGGLDADQLDGLDLSEMSSEEVEHQMQTLYELMQAGQNPFDDDHSDGSADDDLDGLD